MSGNFFKKQRTQDDLWPNYFDRSIWFTFLLRSDVRGDELKLDDEEAKKKFLMWFYCFGQKQYRCSPMTSERRQVFWENVPFPLGIPHPPVPRILAYLLEVRTDVVQGVRVAEPQGWERALAWLFFSGLEEFGLREIVDDSLRAWLHEVVFPDSEFPMTRLAAFRWSLDRDLPVEWAAPEERRRVSAWLYTMGLVEGNVWPLMSGAMVDELFERTAWCQGRRLPWHAYVCWLAGMVEPPLTLSTPEAVDALAVWYADVRPLVLAGRPPAPESLPPPAPVQAVREPGCTLVGYARGELGVGEDVRMMAAALQAHQLPFTILDRSETLQSRTKDASVLSHVATTASHRALVFCFTAFDTVNYVLEQGLADLQDRYVIGYWPWELPSWPAAWRAAFDLVDEIWVSSRYTQEAFCLTSPVPVLHMPMAVEIPTPESVSRQQLGFAHDEVLFLYVFDANSYLDRKNPLAAVRAFRRAFPGGERVGLVLKVMNARSEAPLWRAVLEEVAGDPRIRLVTATLDKAQVLGLMQACDVYLSLHRAEGFGRTLAEAMLLGRPVIATAWSGSDELVQPEVALPVHASLIPVEPGRYPWGEGMVWADPDLEHAAWNMRCLAQNPMLRARLGAAGQAFVQARHGARKVGQRYRERLAALGMLDAGTRPQGI